MARAALGWSRTKLSADAHLAQETLRAFERGVGKLHINHVLAITAALERGGAVFSVAIDGALTLNFRGNPIGMCFRGNLQEEGEPMKNASISHTIVSSVIGLPTEST